VLPSSVERDLGVWAECGLKIIHVQSHHLVAPVVALIDALTRHSTLGNRAFPVTAARCWNESPVSQHHRRHISAVVAVAAADKPSAAVNSLTALNFASRLCSTLPVTEGDGQWRIQDLPKGRGEPKRVSRAPSGVHSPWWGRRGEAFLLKAF